LKHSQNYIFEQLIVTLRTVKSIALRLPAQALLLYWSYENETGNASDMVFRVICDRLAFTLLLWSPSHVTVRSCHHALFSTETCRLSKFERSQLLANAADVVVIM